MHVRELGLKTISYGGWQWNQTSSCFIFVTCETHVSCRLKHNITLMYIHLCGIIIHTDIDDCTKLVSLTSPKPTYINISIHTCNTVHHQTKMLLILIYPHSDDTCSFIPYIAVDGYLLTMCSLMYIYVCIIMWYHYYYLVPFHC